MDFMKGFIEGYAEFKKQCENDGDHGEAQAEKNAKEMHARVDRNYEDACKHSAFLRMLATIGVSGKEKERLDARLDIADAFRDIQHELTLLSRIGDKSELSEEEWLKLHETRDYMQMVLEGIRQFKQQIEEFKPEAKDGDEVC